MSKPRRPARSTGRSGSRSTSSSAFPVAAPRRRNSVDVHIELLLGTKVRDADDNVVGRIEEFRVDDDARVESYLIGASALVERLSAWTLVRPISLSLRARKVYIVYEVGCQNMDLTDLKRPKLRIAKRDLRHAR